MTTLKDHTRSGQHLKNCERKGVPVILDFTMPKNIQADRDQAIQELKYAALHADCNLAYKNSKTFSKKLGNIDKKSVFAKADFKVGATKVRNLVVNVISPSEKENLAKILKKTKFSLCMDESTDRGGVKVMLIMVRYTDPEKNKVVTKQWDMAPVFLEGEIASAGAERLFNCIVLSLQSHGVDLVNILSCCTDGCSTMTGVYSGLKARFKEIYPNIIWRECPAHKTHLCASNAVQSLPKEIVDYVRNCYSMLNSPNKWQNFKIIQNKKK